MSSSRSSSVLSIFQGPTSRSICLKNNIYVVVYFIIPYVGYVPNDVIPKVFMAVTLDLRDDPAE